MGEANERMDESQRISFELGHILKVKSRTSRFMAEFFSIMNRRKLSNTARGDRRSLSIACERLTFRRRDWVALRTVRVTILVS